MKRTLFAALFAVVAPVLHAESVVLTPEKDSDVYSFLNMPLSPDDLGVSNTPASNAPSVHSQKTLIQFDLSGLAIPAGQVGSATLRLYSLPPGSEQGGSFRAGNLVVFRQGAQWGPVTATYPNWNTIQPAGDPVAVFPVTVFQQWIEIDVTPLVRDWVAGTHPNYGFVLQCEDEHVPAGETTNLLFGSMELGKKARDAGAPEESQPYPKLVITRGTETPAEPPVLAVFRGEAGIVLEWPAAGSEGWTLQAAVSPAGPWEAVGGEPVQSEGRWRVERPLHASGREFFRLEKP